MVSILSHFLFIYIYISVHHSKLHGTFEKMKKRNQSKWNKKCKLTHLDRCLSFGFVTRSKTWKCTKLVDYLHLNCYDALTRSNFLLTFYSFIHLFYFIFSLLSFLLSTNICVINWATHTNIYGANARNLFGLVGSLRLILCRLDTLTRTHTHQMREGERKRHAHHT